MKNLDEKILEKTSQMEKTVNPILKKRFEDIIKKLTSEYDLKKVQLIETQMKLEEGDTYKIFFLILFSQN